MKVYARQIPPEYQESYLFDDDAYGPDYINVWGNKDYNERISPLFERVRDTLYNGELAEAISNIETKSGYYNNFYKNVTEAINDMLPSENRKYSTKDIHDIKQLVTEFSHCHSSKEYGILCDVLSIVTGYEWDYKQIRGSYQGCWNYVFYPVNDWSKERLNEFETMYFNDGSEWIVHEGDTAPDCAEDIKGYSVYCVSWNDEGIRKEIAEAECAAPEDVILYAYKGVAKIPIYEEVG